MPIIAIAGMPGCGSSTIGRLLAKKLNIRFLSIGDYYKSFGIGKPTQRAITVQKTDRGQSREFNWELEKMQADEAIKGDIVVDGKISIKTIWFADYSIWLKAPLNIRAGRVAKRDKITLEEAEKILMEKESLEKRTFQKLYNIDFFNQEKDAKIVIDVGEKDPEEIIKIILEHMSDRGPVV